jgi:5-dehydro-4-deoxyglucarate dehydratase
MKRETSTSSVWLWRKVLPLIILGVSFTVTSINGQTTSFRKIPLSPQQFKEKLKGPILSAPTAFDSTFEVDYKGMSKVINHALDFGCKVVTLTSGNSMYDRLSYAEIKRLTSLMVETVGKRGVTIAATGKWPMDTILDYVHFAEKIGASAVQVDPPENSDLDSNIERTVQFYKIVAANTHLAIVLHGFYSVKLLDELVKINSIVALKEDVADLNYYVDRQIMFGKRLAVFAGGSDSRYLFGYPYGSPAYFSVLYSYAPDIGLKFWKAVQQKDLKTAVMIATKYDIPFMKRWTRPFWAAAIEYMGGSQRYMRPKKGETQNLKTLNEEELKKMQEFLCQLGLKPEKCPYCAVVTEGIPLPQEWKRGGHVGGKVNGKVIVAGGTDWSLDKNHKSWLKNSAVFTNGRWELGPELPKALSYSMYASDTNGIYIAGGTSDGKTNLTDAYRLNSLKNGWQPLPSLPVPVAYGSGAILNGKFYVTCGFIDTTKTNKMWVLDVNEKGSHWHECAPLPAKGRILPALIASGKYIYLLGGLADFSPLTPLKGCFRYDPLKNQWQRLADLPLDGYAWVGKAIDNNHLLLTGRAYGKVDSGIWVINLKDMSMDKVGNDIEPAATATLIKVGVNEWWLIGGEPDSNKNRTPKVSVITLN